jgi:hypothetical protein
MKKVEKKSWYETWEKNKCYRIGNIFLRAVSKVMDGEE